MSDDYKREDKTHRKEEPDRTGSTLIKYLFMAIITIAILFFIAVYILPMFSGDGGGTGNGNDNNSDLNINVDIGDGNNDNGGDNGNNGNN